MNIEPWSFILYYITTTSDTGSGVLLASGSDYANIDSTPNETYRDLTALQHNILERVDLLDAPE